MHASIWIKVTLSTTRRRMSPKDNQHGRQPDRQLDIRLHNAVDNNQQISFLDGMFHRHNNFVISINDVKVADYSICFLKYSKRKKKKWIPNANAL